MPLFSLDVTTPYGSSTVFGLTQAQVNIRIMRWQDWFDSCATVFGRGLDVRFTVRPYPRPREER